MFCNKCGSLISDDAVICPNCGCYATNQPKQTIEQSNKIKMHTPSVLQTLANIFMILSCIFNAILILPLFWMIPMTVSYNSRVRRNEEIGLTFKICTLLFVNILAGIFMLCEKD